MLQILLQYQNLFLSGLIVTLELFSLTVIIGLTLGTCLGTVAAKYSADMDEMLNYLKFTIKAIPFIVLLFWLHYPLQSMFSVVIDPFYTAVFALSLVNTILTASLVSSELKMIPKSYTDAGKTLGLSKYEIVYHIELPLLWRRIIPSLLLNQASILEYTLFTSLISVPEVFRISQSINSMIYRPVEIYSLLILFFMIILGPIHILVSKLETSYSIKYA